MEILQKPDWIRRPSWSGLNVTLIGGQIGEYDQRWADGGAVGIASDFDRLYLLEAGAAEVSWRGGGVDLRPGRLYLFPADGTLRYYHCPASMTLGWLHFRADLLPGVSIFRLFRPAADVAAPEVVRSTFADTLAALNSDTPDSFFRAVSGLLAMLAVHMPADWGEVLPTEGRQMQLLPALEYLRTRADRPVTLQEVAAEVGLHPTYFSNLFRSVFGLSPLRYHRDLRLRRARSLLAEGSASVAEVGRACGFEDPLYFSRVFRQVVGIPPRAYRTDGHAFHP